MKEAKAANKENTTEEQKIRDLIESWAEAVSQKDYEGILANHSDDILMFDVPPPPESRGIAAFRKTWDTFFSWAKEEW